MDGVLVDTSVWIAALRPGVPIGELIGSARPLVCLPVIQEVLQGVDAERFWDTRRTLLDMEIVEPLMSVGIYEEAAHIFRLARRSGFTIRTSNDLLIAACALRHRLRLVHFDRDFTTIARVTPLRAYNLAN